MSRLKNFYNKESATFEIPHFLSVFFQKK